jgi:hypothetical protein
MEFFKIKEVCSSESVLGFDNEFIVRAAANAICFAVFKKLKVSFAHTHFVLLTKCVRGLASMPQEETPCFLHSTLVVPVPQKGSKTNDV